MIMKKFRLLFIFIIIFIFVSNGCVINNSKSDTTDSLKDKKTLLAMLKDEGYTVIKDFDLTLFVLPDSFNNINSGGELFKYIQAIRNNSKDSYSLQKGENVIVIIEPKKNKKRVIERNINNLAKVIFNTDLTQYKSFHYIHLDNINYYYNANESQVVLGYENGSLEDFQQFEDSLLN